MSLPSRRQATHPRCVFCVPAEEVHLMVRLFVSALMVTWLLGNGLVWLAEVRDVATGVQLVFLSTPATLVLLFFLLFSPKLES
jgi:hypothetical protein